VSERVALLADIWKFKTETGGNEEGKVTNQPIQYKWKRY
jgi:hypothetical protein